MTHPYPPHWPKFFYIGRFQYSLTFATFDRRVVFDDADVVARVLEQILRAARERHFALIAYCFMPDHVHLVVAGETDAADAKAFIKAAKQYSGYYYAQARRGTLWARYCYEHVIREDMELAMTIQYVVANPVRAGLARHPRDYPFLGSSKYTVEELLQWCEYSDAVL